jgi:hypothetical protein
LKYVLFPSAVYLNINLHEFPAHILGDLKQPFVNPQSDVSSK